MADKDVSLVIKARDEATRAIDTAADALKNLSKIQNDVGTSAGKADDLLGKLGDELKALQDQTKGLSALGAIATQLDKAAAAVGRLESQVGKTTADIERFAQASAEEDARTAALTAQIEAQTKALAAQQEAQRRAREELTQANAALRSQESVLARINKQYTASNPPTAQVAVKRQDQQDTVAELRARQSVVQASYEAEKAGAEATKKALADLNSQLVASVDNQTKLERALASGQATLARENEGLTTGANSVR
jgi:chromosome segregation ATPase